jgi:hypothetical protein
VPTAVNAGIGGGDNPTLTSGGSSQASFGAGLLVVGALLLGAGAVTVGLRRGQHGA